MVLKGVFSLLGDFCRLAHVCYCRTGMWEPHKLERGTSVANSGRPRHESINTDHNSCVLAHDSRTQHPRPDS
jgi:hypothetical protein